VLKGGKEKKKKLEEQEDKGETKCKTDGLPKRS
jgi:hypothetical protein